MSDDLTTRQTLLLSNVLDALDDLFDQRDRADLWAWRVLVATAEALRDTSWHDMVLDAAQSLATVVQSTDDPTFRYERALAATGRLRLRVAALDLAND